MKRVPLFLFLSFLFHGLNAQLQARVIDAASGEPLASASVILFSSGKRTGLVANKEGTFSIRSLFDSMRVSMVGYDSRTIFQKDFELTGRFDIKLKAVPAE